MKALVICRTLRNGITPGAITDSGQKCHTCQEPLGVSPEGLAQILAGGIPLCTICGLLAAALAKQRGTVEFQATEHGRRRYNSLSPEDREIYDRLMDLTKEAN